LYALCRSIGPAGTNAASQRRLFSPSSFFDAQNDPRTIPSWLFAAKFLRLRLE
jgi:hypothetical protein